MYGNIRIICSPLAGCEDVISHQVDVAITKPSVLGRRGCCVLHEARAVEVRSRRVASNGCARLPGDPMKRFLKRLGFMMVDDGYRWL